MKCMLPSASTMTAFALAAIVVATVYLTYRDVRLVAQLVSDMRDDIAALVRAEADRSNAQPGRAAMSERDDEDGDYEGSLEEEEDEEDYEEDGTRSSEGNSAADLADLADEGDADMGDGAVVAVLSAVQAGSGHTAASRPRMAVITEDEPEQTARRTAGRTGGQTTGQTTGGPQ